MHCFSWSEKEKRRSESKKNSRYRWYPSSIDWFEMLIRNASCVTHTRIYRNVKLREVRSARKRVSGKGATMESGQRAQVWLALHEHAFARDTNCKIEPSITNSQSVCKNSLATCAAKTVLLKRSFNALQRHDLRITICCNNDISPKFLVYVNLRTILETTLRSVSLGQ